MTSHGCFNYVLQAEPAPCCHTGITDATSVRLLKSGIVSPRERACCQRRLIQTYKATPFVSAWDTAAVNELQCKALHIVLWRSAAVCCVSTFLSGMESTACPPSAPGATLFSLNCRRVRICQNDKLHSDFTIIVLKNKIKSHSLTHNILFMWPLVPHMCWWTRAFSFGPYLRLYL